MMMSPKRQTFDLGSAGSSSGVGSTTLHFALPNGSSSHLASGSTSSNGGGGSGSAGRTHVNGVNGSNRKRPTPPNITFADPYSQHSSGRSYDDDSARIPYRDRKLSESVVSLTGVAEEEEIVSSPISFTAAAPSFVSSSATAHEEDDFSSSFAAAGAATRPLSPGTRASPMARSSSQRRISQEIHLNHRNNAINGSSAAAAAARGSTSPLLFGGGGVGMRNSISGGSSGDSSDDARRNGAGSGLYVTPVRHGAVAPVRRNSARIAPPTPLRSHSARSMSFGGAPALTQACADSSMDDHLESSSDAHTAYDGDLSPIAAAYARVPFPRSFSSTGVNMTNDSPSARRIGRHLSLSAAQSTDSINDVPPPLSPRFGVARIASVQGRHVRYGSELNVKRPVFTTSQSEASFDNYSRSRLSSDMGGSMYANTLDDSTTYSGVKISRESSTNVKPSSKHRLVLQEEGKTDVILQLGNCIGRGQFGSVYRALNLNTGQMVAVKRIKLNNRSEDEVTQLMREVELLKSLVHPSVVKYEGLSRGEDVVSIVLEYVENGSLLHTLKAFGNFPEKLVASYVVKILEGLNYLHEMKVVHCDLKAANILTTKNGNVKLSDFGVSLNLKAAEDLKKNDAIGTPNWMAPEVIELKGASTAADIWSLGCTIIELLTGKPPYGDILAMSAMWRIVEDDCPPLPDNISEPLHDFLTQCFQKDPLLRPSAEMLFMHAWLRNTWTDHKALRPQDSVPFFKRIASTETRKDSIRKASSSNKGSKGSSGRARQHTVTQADVVFASATPSIEESLAYNNMKRSDSSPQSSVALRPHLIAMRASSAPDAWSSNLNNGNVQIAESSTECDTTEDSSMLTPAGLSASLSVSPPTLLSFDVAPAANRRGSDVGSAATSLDILRSPSLMPGSGGGGGGPTDRERLLMDGGIPLDASMLDLNGSDVFLLDEQQSQSKTHAFVKTTFSKAVQCKICRESVKKHAVLCEECGLICHASCARKASTPCNLRAQLLMLANNHRSSTDIIRVMSPVPSASTPPPPTPTSIASPPVFRFPFGKSKRNSKAGASDLNLPVTLSASPRANLLEADALNDGVNERRCKSPPLTPISPTGMVTATPTADKENDKSGNKRRSRRISLLPSHLMRNRSPSPAEAQPRASMQAVAAAAEEIRQKAVGARSGATAATSAEKLQQEKRASSATEASHVDDPTTTTASFGSNASSVSSTFQLGSPISQNSSTGRSVFPSIDLRNEQQSDSKLIDSSTAVQHVRVQEANAPRKDVPRRRQRFLSTGAMPLSIGSTPNLISGQKSPLLPHLQNNSSNRRPDVPTRQASQGMPWRRGQFSSSGQLDHSMCLEEGCKVDEAMTTSAAGGLDAHIETSTQMPHIPFEQRKHMRRVSAKQDCIIA